MIPESVKFVGTRAFIGCRSLTRAVFECDIDHISDDMFRDCVVLEEVILHDGERYVVNKD